MSVLASMNRTMQFILPDQNAVQAAAGGSYSYAIYNYYGKGPISRAKRYRFVHALKIAQDIPAKRVIDMGAADGMFLPTLCKHYDHVAALDINDQYIQRSQKLVEALDLSNAQVICTKEMSFEQIKSQIGGGYQIMYLLETLEHVGQQPDMWGTKMQFVHECFDLLEKDGRIIISVPKMVGIAMLFKNILQRSLGLGYDGLSWPQLLKSSFFKNTDDLEPLWDGGHMGFNHLKLDKLFNEQFKVHHRSESSITVFYMIGRK